MTTTIVFGDTGDGCLVSSNATYSTMRSGSGVAFPSGLPWGQEFFSPNYNGYQAFLGFTYTVPAGEKVTAAYIRLKAISAQSTSISRVLTLVEYNWGASLDVTDWRTPAQITAITTLLANITNAEDAGANYFMAGSDALVSRLGSAGPLRVMGTSDRFRIGTTPTVDETANFAFSLWTGTVDDPALVFTSAPQSRLFGVLGAQVQLSDGTHAYLESQNETGSGSVYLYHHNGTSATALQLLPSGAGSNQYDVSNGLQALALVADASDNLYVVGAHDANPIGQILVSSYPKGVGYTWGWYKTESVSMPSYTEGAFNNFAAAWHNVGTNGTIMVVASHTSGRTPNTTGDIVYALLGCQNLLTSSGTLLRNSGSARSVVTANVTGSSYYTGYGNETGSCLDVVAAPSTTDRGYVTSVFGDDNLGENSNRQYVWRYILNASGTAISDSDESRTSGVSIYGVKDGAAKRRIIGIDATTFVSVTAVGAFYTNGLMISVLQNVGTANTFTTLGTVSLGTTGPASMPSAATLSTSSAWDAVYDTSGNTLWIYYLDVANGNRLMKTAVDMNTYLATGVGIQVSAAIGAAGSTNYAIRVNRGKTNGQKVLVSVASKTSGGTHSTIYILDTLNVAPNAPTLTAKANFDATASSVFTWTFSDTNAGDTQSAYQLQIDNASTGASAVDTGKVTSTTSNRTVAAATLSNGVSYRWRVRTYDAGDLVGTYSSYGTFSTSAGGTVTITSPATDNPAGIVTDDYNIVWSVSGTTQASYRVVVTRTSNSTVLVDTGYVTSTATTYNVTGMLSDVQYQISVTVRNSALVVSGAGTRLITPSYGNPEQPTFTAIAGTDHILISVNNPTPGSVTLGTTEDGFETGVTNYTPIGGTLTQSIEQAYAGTNSAKFVVTGTPTQAYFRQTNAAAVAVVPGQRYTVRFRAYSVGGYANLGRSIDWQDASHTYLSTGSTTISIASGAWTLQEDTFTAPVNAAFAVFGPALTGNPPTGTTLYTDELILVAANDRPNPTANQILRRVNGSGTPYTVVGTATVDGSYKDYAVASGVTYQYIVRGTA